MSIYEKIIQLSRDTMLRYQPDKLKWMWGEALLMHSFGLLAEQNPEINYDEYIKAYLNHHIEKGYRVDQSDTLAPALAAYYMYKKEPLSEYKTIIDKAIDYILNSEKIIENMPNHLGHSLEGKFYPKSIWVDSIMMYGVFTSLYAIENNNQELNQIKNEVKKMEQELKKDNFQEKEGDERDCEKADKEFTDSAGQF